MSEVKISAAEKRRLKLLARAGKVESGQTIGSTSTEEVKKEKQEIDKVVEEKIESKKQEIIKEMENSKTPKKEEKKVDKYKELV